MSWIKTNWGKCGLVVALLLLCYLVSNHLFKWHLKPMGYGELEKLLAVTAWPTVILVLGLVYKESLKALLSRMKGWDSPVGKLEFEVGINVAEQAIGLTQLKPLPIPANDRTTTSQIESTVFKDPGQSVLMGWDFVNESLLLLRSLTERPAMPDIIFFNDLQHRGILNADDVVVLNQLRKLRNIAAHNPTFLDAQGASDYVKLALHMGLKLKQVARELPLPAPVPESKQS